jgi:hypothetical protein
MKLEASAQPPPVRPARRISGYLVFWVLLATAAVGYLAVAAMKPDLIVARLAPGSEQQLAEPSAADRRTSELADELLMLRRWLTDLQRDFAETRATVLQHASTERSLADKVATIEDRLAAQDTKAEAPRAEAGAPERPAGTKSSASLSTEQVLKAMSAPETPPPAPPAQKMAAAPKPTPPAPATSKAPAVRDATPAAPISTGTIPATPPPASAKATAPAPQRTLGIELSGGESLEALRSGWDQLSRQHTQTLRGLSARYRTAVQGEEQPLRLVAGPFANQADANRVCAELRSKQVACRIGAFTGNAL